MRPAGSFPAEMQHKARVVVEMLDEPSPDQPQQQRCWHRPGALRTIRRANPEGIAPLPPQDPKCLRDASSRIVDVGLLRDHAVQLDHLEPRPAQRIGTRRNDVKPTDEESRVGAADRFDPPLERRRAQIPAIGKGGIMTVEADLEQMHALAGCGNGAQARRIEDAPRSRARRDPRAGAQQLAHRRAAVTDNRRMDHLRDRDELPAGLAWHALVKDSEFDAVNETLDDRAFAHAPQTAGEFPEIARHRHRATALSNIGLEHDGERHLPAQHPLPHRPQARAWVEICRKHHVLRHDAFDAPEPLKDYRLGFPRRPAIGHAGVRRGEERDRPEVQREPNQVEKQWDVRQPLAAETAAQHGRHELGKTQPGYGVAPGRHRSPPARRRLGDLAEDLALDHAELIALRGQHALGLPAMYPAVPCGPNW